MLKFQSRTVTTAAVRTAKLRPSAWSAASFGGLRAGEREERRQEHRLHRGKCDLVELEVGGQDGLDVEWLKGAVVQMCTERRVERLRLPYVAEVDERAPDDRAEQ